MSDDFFERCEKEYPNAVKFVRKYIPLGWPSEKKENFEPIHMSSKELEQQVLDILQNGRALNGQLKM